MPGVPAIDTAARRCAAVLAVGLLLPPVLAGCGGSEDTSEGKSGAARDVAVTARDRLADGGTLRWAVDAMPATLNAFQTDADETTDRIADATLPALFTLDSRAKPQLNRDYLESAEVTEREPHQTVVYTLSPKARWSDGKPIGLADFRAQWKALGGSNNAYWTARNAGYDRIHKVEKGDKPRQVKVTFARPYSDWQSLFTPLYPRPVMGKPKAFNDDTRTRLAVSGGPFRLKGGKLDHKADEIALERNPKWWGQPAKLDEIVLTAIDQKKRGKALARGKLDLAEIEPPVMKKIVAASDPRRDPAKNPAGNNEENERKGEKKAQAERKKLRGYAVRRAYDPAYTQLALNGASGPLRDERVRRGIARALDRKKLAEAALDPAGLPGKALGSHLRMFDQDGYHDNSGAIGEASRESASALLAEAGWRGGPSVDSGQGDAQEDAKRDDSTGRAPVFTALTHSAAIGHAAVLRQVAHADARAAKTAEENFSEDAEERLKTARASMKKAEKAEAALGEFLGGLLRAEGGLVRKKEGKELELRMVLPAGDGSKEIRHTGERIVRMLDKVGVRAKITQVRDEAFFKDHIASGDFDLALYSWPASAYPITDARPIFAKPEPAADGSLLIEQNYTRVGTDQIDHLFEQAAGELDERAKRDLIKRIDARVWATAGSIPLYQRPQLVAADKKLGNVGAFGFETPRYQDIGYVK
ncbi:ABC transporter family substrate-binding protein [Streptomyces gobiensis]|uniref:ABC transporter family substrate-binding protein n=1 Tax=Streptomyces gobiensis TaxID=2875706 RepID=UPI001E4A958E|nr:ABC transporter family substrate-binding protein [Streptomyces gobiensis]UGY93452.1 ABC transporter family substrate-binding protein [Streptomyces gobiensis]